MTYLVSASDPISSATGISFVHTSAMRSFSLLESIAVAEWNHFHSRDRSQIHNRRRQCVNMWVKRCQSTILNEHINAETDGEWTSWSNDSVPAWRKRGEMVVLFPSSVINLQPAQGGGSTLLCYLLLNVRHAGISSTSSMRLLTAKLTQRWKFSHKPSMLTESWVKCRVHRVFLKLRSKTALWCFPKQLK